MNKVVLLSDHEQLASSSFSWAMLLQEQAPILLTGVFLPTASYLDLLVYYSGSFSTPVYEFQESENAVTTEANAAATFRKMCVKSHIEYRIHEVEGSHIADTLQKETRFADLLICCNEAAYKNIEDVIFNDYTRDLLSRSECPILLVPSEYFRPKNVILAYDGSADAVAAIKQFAHTLPGLTRLDTLIVYMHADAKESLPDQAYLEELAARHFMNLQFFKAPLNPGKHLDKWLHDQKETILVTGAYGRDTIAQLFHKSFVSDLLKKQKLPIFIAHK